MDYDGPSRTLPSEWIRNEKLEGSASGVELATGKKPSLNQALKRKLNVAKRPTNANTISSNARLADGKFGNRRLDQRLGDLSRMH